MSGTTLRMNFKNSSRRLMFDFGKSRMRPNRAASNFGGRTDMRMKLSVGSRCSACGELITRIEDGWVEWLAGEDVDGVTALKDLRLLHRLGTGPETKSKRYARQYDSLREFRTDRS